MKRFIAGLTLLFVLAPSFAFAATDDAVRASIVQTLLSVFVSQVNAIQSILDLEKTAANPASFSTFDGLARQQLALTTQQLATLLNPGTNVSQPGAQDLPVAGSSVPSSTSGSSSSNSTMDNTLTVSLIGSTPPSIAASGHAGQMIGALAVANNTAATIAISGSESELEALLGISLDEVSPDIKAKKSDGSAVDLSSDLSLFFTNGNTLNVLNPDGTKPKTKPSQASLSSWKIQLEPGQTMNISIKIADQLNGKEGSFKLNVGQASGTIQVVAAQ